MTDFRPFISEFVYPTLKANLNCYPEIQSFTAKIPSHHRQVVLHPMLFLTPISLLFIGTNQDT